jgi:hypothetical protein
MMLRSGATAFAVWVLIAASAHGQWTVVSLHSSGFDDSAGLAGHGQYQGGTASLSGLPQAVLWNGSSQSWQSLSPGISGMVLGMDGATQVGQVASWACMWSGTAQSRVILHPSGADGSAALGTWGDQQAGYSWSIAANAQHAALWRGTALSHINLHPAGAVRSEATAVAAGQQGGAAFYNVFGTPHPRAALWSGTAESYTELHPGGASSSGVYGMAPGQQVGGVMFPSSSSHAALWTGTATSFVDLHPSNASYSLAYATCGSAQVGYAGLAVPSAVIWFGSASSMVNLHALLPAGEFFQSHARAVSFVDGQYYVVGTATRIGGSDQAWLWVGVPAPSGLGLLAAAGVVAARRRRR